ncbi:claudin-4-like [Puntigrus tetrazona]|uniref:claudin-4-like n=1 Tax=Puntigrus tetrazona TaxID=1606681 RepID=UPI001C8A6865|nr:claudin-4-like [Puntigrus tetrazona]
MNIRVELAVLGLASAGWFCAILTKFLPMWHVTGMVENITTTLPLYWDGVWLNWQHHTTGRLHCAFYQSLLNLTEHFNTWKILVITSIGLGALAVGVYPLGWIRYPKNILLKVASGPVFVASGLVLLVVISWTTHLTASKAGAVLTREFGSAIYAGWMGTALLVVGGVLLTIICSVALGEQRRDESATRSSEPGAQEPLQTIQSASFTRYP